MTGPRLASRSRGSVQAAPGGDVAVKLTAGMLVQAATQPLLQRFRLGEGGLIGMATWAAAWQARDLVTAISVFALTCMLLAALYLFNDVSDRTIDAHNPKKIARYRQPLLEQPQFFRNLSLGMHAVVCLTAWLVLGAWAATCAALLLLLNPLYSRVGKRVPGLDVLVVGVMGGAAVGLATASPQLLLLAAAMTGVSHAFQMRVDKDADRAAGVRSSAAASPAIRSAVWIGLLIWLTTAVYLQLGLTWAATAFVPYLLLSRGRQPNRDWNVARLYFAALWIGATV
jgi:4-hydroxybenzoate polyprenyltransferase